MLSTWQGIYNGGRVIGMKDQYYVEYRDLGLSIAYFRKAKGLSQQQLAESMKVNAETVSRMENANTGITADTLFALSKALGTPLGTLFTHAKL